MLVRARFTAPFEPISPAQASTEPAFGMSAAAASASVAVIVAMSSRIGVLLITRLEASPTGNCPLWSKTPREEDWFPLGFAES